MGRKKEYTPNSRIRSCLRKLWLRSRERAKALKNYNYCCADCGVKQTKTKNKQVILEVHHVDEIDWTDVFDFIRKRILQTPDRLKPLCNTCHDKYKDSKHA